MQEDVTGEAAVAKLLSVEALISPPNNARAYI
jgi:hypothetical protein